MRREISNWIRGRRRVSGQVDTLSGTHNLLTLLGKEEGHFTLRFGPNTLIDQRYSLATASRVLESWFNQSDNVIAVHHEIFRGKQDPRHYVDVREYRQPSQEFNNGKPYLLRYATIDFTVR